MTKLIDKWIPNKIVTFKTCNASWMNEDIRKLRDLKKLKHKKARRTNKYEDWATYRKTRNHLKAMIREAKVNKENMVTEQIQKV